MGLLDEVVTKAMAKPAVGSEDQTSGLVGVIMEMVRNQPGGLSGLVQTFHEKGLGGIVNSWVSTGQNLPISAEQIQGVLGNEKVNQLAAKVGIPSDVASSKLAEMLPTLVDKLTPDGRVPESEDLLQKALSFLNRPS